MIKSGLLTLMLSISLCGCAVEIRTAGMKDNQCEGAAGSCSVIDHDGGQVVHVRDLEGYIHAYIQQHPDEILGAAAALRERQGRDMAVKAAAAGKEIIEHHDEIFSTAGDPILGNPKGDVVLVEFFDYQCSACKAEEPVIEALLKADPGVKIILKEYPLVEPGGAPHFGPGSISAAKASKAAWLVSPTKFFALHAAIMADPSTEGHLTDDLIYGHAAQAGYEVDKLRAASSSPETGAMLERNRLLAQKLGIDATPTFILGDRLLPGAVPLPAWVGMIRDIRAKEAAQQSSANSSH